MNMSTRIVVIAIWALDNLAYGERRLERRVKHYVRPWAQRQVDRLRARLYDRLLDETPPWPAPAASDDEMHEVTDDYLPPGARRHVRRPHVELRW